MKQRHTFHVEWVESLETRELLSGAAAQMVNARALAAQRAAHVATARANQQLDRGNLIPQGPINTSFTTPTANGAVSTRPSRLHGNTTTTRVTKAATPVSIVYGNTPGSYNFNSASGAVTPNMQGAPIANGRYRPGSYQTSPNTNTSLNRSQSSATNGMNVAGSLPSQAGAIVNPAKVVVPASRLASADASTATTSADGSASILPAPLIYGMFDNATLSKTDVAALKSAVSKFATSFTYGADEAKDKAAGDALRAEFNDLALSVWAQTHVASAQSVTKLQDAVDSFTKSYTSGADLSKDKAAWQALNSGMTQFTRDLLASSTGSDKGMFDGGTMLMTPPPIGMGAGAIQWAADDILNGPALTKDDVSRLTTMVDTFAANYTSGVDSAKDLAVAETFQKDFTSLTQARWDRAYPPTPADAGLGSGIMAMSGLANPMARKVTTQANPVTAPNPLHAMLGGRLGRV